MVQIFDMTGVDLLFSDMMITVAAEAVYAHGKLDTSDTTIFVGDYNAIAFGEHYISTGAIVLTSVAQALEFIRSALEPVYPLVPQVASRKFAPPP